jgi:hypothetical protein
MPYDRLTDAEIEAGEFILSSTATKIQSNQDFFAGQIGTLAAIQLSNGSFEIASDAAQPNLPDNWDPTRYPNGVFVLDTANPRHGAKIAKFTHPGGAGNGGGQLVSDYFEISPDPVAHSLAVTFWTTDVDVRIQVIIQYFDEDQVSLGADETLYNHNDAGTGPDPGNTTTAGERRVLAMSVPATARYLKVKLVGGATDTDPGASTDIYFDQVKIITAEIGSPQRVYEAGSNIIAASDTEVSTNSTSYVLVKEIEVVRYGELTFDFDLKRTTAGSAFGRIYKNGSAIGTERSTSSTTYVTYSETIKGLKPGDLIQIYAKSSLGGSSTAEVDDFYAKCDFYEVATVNT